MAKQPPVAEASSKPAPPKEPSVPPSEQAKASTEDDKPKQLQMEKSPTDLDSSSSAARKPDSLSSQVLPEAQKKPASPVKTDAAKSSQSFPPTGEKVIPMDSKAMPRPASDSKIVSFRGPSSESKDQKEVDQVQKKEEPKKAQTKTSPKPEAKPVPKGSPIPSGPRPTTGQTTPAPQQPPKPQEQSRRFSLNLGSITDAPKSQPTTPQETVTGKLFGFGASIFSQASNLISTAGQPGPHSQGGPAASIKPAPSPSQPPTSQGPPKSTGQAPPPSAKVIPVKRETKAPVAEKLESKAEEVPMVKRTETDKKPPPVKDSKPPDLESQKAVPPQKPEKITKPKSACPLCKTELNIGSQDPPNFNTCTECKNQVCNLCGFNPTPHLTEVSNTYIAYACVILFFLRYFEGQISE
jgi:protein piccolo